MPYRGLLDRLDRMDAVLLSIELDIPAGHPDAKKQLRENQTRLASVRLELVEVRRMIERADQATKT